jgi:hypothetical protein
MKENLRKNEMNISESRKWKTKNYIRDANIVTLLSIKNISLKISYFSSGI